MRTVFAVALCFVVGACATTPDIYGIYDLVSINGESIPNDASSSIWMEWRSDGSWTSHATVVGVPEPVVEDGQSSVEDEVDGCVPFQAWGNEAPDELITGTVCDGVISGTSPEGPFVMNKRR